MIARALWIFAAVGFFLGPAATPAAAKKWTNLGECSVSRGANREVIRVQDHPEAYRKIKLRARGADVRILDMKIQFADGSIQDVKVRELVPAGKSSRSIDLYGKARVIRKVEFLCATDADAKEGALVRLAGKR